MSRNRKNHHYRYAQKFEHEQKRMNYRRLLTAPLVFALLVLLAFGIISTTFSIYVTEVEPGQSVTTDNGLIVKVRSKKITDDIVDGAELAKKATEEPETETEAASDQIEETAVDDTPEYIIANQDDDITVTRNKNTDLAAVGYDTVGIHTNATISGNWDTTNLSTSDGNYYTGTIYFKGKTSGNYEMGIKINNDWKVFGGYWINDNTWYNTNWGSGSNDQIPPISTSTSTYIKGLVYFYKEYSGKPRLKIDQEELSALSTTVSVGSSTLTSGGTTTVGKTNSGGSGSYSNTYTVKQGSASGTDVTSSVLSGTTFTAPTVSSSTKYYVTTTVTDSNTGATATSSAKTITVNPPAYCTISSSVDSISLNLGETTSFTVNAVNHSSGSIRVTSNNTSQVKVCATQNGTYADNVSVAKGGTVYVKAFAPVTSGSLTASCAASHASSVSKTISVSVATPSISSISYSTSQVYAGTSSVAPTVTLTGCNAGTTVTSATYSFSSSSNSTSSNGDTLDPSTGVITAGTTTTNTNRNVYAKLTVSYNGVNYAMTSYDSSHFGTYTVHAYYIKGFGDWSADGEMFVYNSSTGKYTAEKDLTQKTYANNGSTDGFKVYSTAGTDYYGYSGVTLTTSSDNHWIWNNSGSNTNLGITAPYTGTHIFEISDIQEDSGAWKMKIKVYFPHQVSFNMKSHGTQVSAQIIKYGGTVTKPTNPTATGYTFGGWYKETGCTNAWNFSTDTVTTDKTLYAKWTAKQYNINYYDSGGSAFSGTHGSGYPTKHTYGTATTLVSPTKDYYTFGGWFTTSNCATGTNVTSLGATAYTADINLYAKWTPTTYYIDLYHNGGTVSTSGWTLNNTYYRKSYTYESSAITLPTPTRDGYTFVGWYTTNASSGGTKVTSVPNHSNGNKTYYARWTINDYTVTLHQEYSGSYTAAVLSSSWGTGLTNISRNVNEQTTFGYRVTTSTITLPTAEDFTSPVVVSGVNYIFNGWYENSSFTGSAVTEITTGSSGDRILYARWDAPIPINFYNNVNGSLISTEYCATGGSVTPPSPPSISGYTAVSNSWLDSSGEDVNSSVFSNITASAKYYAKYNINAPTGELSVSSDPAILEGTGTENDPIFVEYGATLTGTGTLTASQYTDARSSNNQSTLKHYYSDTYPIDPLTGWDDATTDTTHIHSFDTTKTILLANKGVYYWSAKSSYQGYINPSVTYESEAATLKIYYYCVNSPITAFDFATPQKIYMESDSASSATMPIRATISTKVPDTYKANLRMFDLISGSPLTYGYQDIINDEVKDLPKLHDTDPTADEAIKVFDSILASYINTRGVKNFDLQVQRPADADPTAYQIDSAAAHISTVVGTKGSSASRVLYFKNNTGSAITGRLTVVYIEGGSMEYQTAQPVKENLYRFIIPASVNNVYFCIADNSVEYRQPYFDGSVITYDSSFTGYKTTSVDVNESAQTYIATNLTGEITGSMGKL